MSDDGGSQAGLESTVDLLARARGGDERALDAVFARTIPPLRRWAHGRLPGWARGMLDTDDLVQETVIGTLKQIDVFEYRVDSALQAYLRQAVMNRIRNEIRRASRHPGREVLDSGAKAPDLSPLEALIDRETIQAYDKALAQLEVSERDAIISRLELGMSYQELAQATNRPSADAARMAVGRAMLKLAKLLDLAP